MKNKGQVSLEYMVMLAISLLIFTAIIAFSMGMLNSVKSQLGVDSAYKAVEEIKEASDFIYVHGHPSKIRRGVRLPGNIERMNLSESLVMISISTGNSYTDVYDLTKANITAVSAGDPPGAMNFICCQDATDVNCDFSQCRGGTFVLNLESMESGYAVNITAG